MADPASLLLAVMLAAPASAPDATQALLPAAVRACVDATSARGVDDTRLRAGGWEAYDVDVGGSGLPLRIYSRGRGPVLIAGVDAESKESGCHVIQPLSAGTGLAAAIDLLSVELHADTTDRKAAEAMWVIGAKGIMLQAVTKDAKPAVHVTVVNIAEGTK